MDGRAVETIKVIVGSIYIHILYQIMPMKITRYVLGEIPYLPIMAVDCHDCYACDFHCQDCLADETKDWFRKTKNIFRIIIMTISIKEIIE